MPGTPSVQAETRVVRFEVAPRSIALVIATGVVAWLAIQLWAVGLILVVALIIAGTLNPVAEWLERHSLGRVQALVVLFIALVLIVGGLTLLALPPLVDQFAELVRQAPASRARLIALLGEHPITGPIAHVVQATAVARTAASVEAFLMSFSAQAIRIAGYGVTTVVLAFYLLADGPRVQGVIFALVPRDRHMRLARILQNMETIVGGYVRGQVITCAAFGIFTFVLLLVLRVPNALSLALFAGFVDVIPFVGGMIVIIPAVLSALPVGLGVAGAVLVALSVYIEFESRILVPRVYGRYLRLSSTAVILALLSGGILMGVLGALLALPVTAGLLMILDELRVDLPGDDSDTGAQDARHARTDAAYEEMSAGATAPEAGVIARTLAADSRETELHPPD